jgi:hypothetical protein
MVIMLRVVRDPRPPISPRDTDVLRLIATQRAPVMLTVYADGRRRYGYWRAVTDAAGRGGCQVALPTEECEELLAAGRIALGEPVTDRSRTVYPVRAVERPRRYAAPVTPSVPAPPRVPAVASVTSRRTALTA